MMLATVSSEVSCPRMISTKDMSGTGFMKCMPMTWSGRLVLAAISVIEIELVFVARIVSGRATASSSENTTDLTSGRSTTASTTKPAMPMSEIEETGCKRAKVWSTSLWVMRSFLSKRPRLFSMAAHAALQGGLRLVDQSDLTAAHRKHLSDAIAHGACADHGDVLEVGLGHARFSTARDTALPPPKHRLAMPFLAWRSRMANREGGQNARSGSPDGVT